MLGDVYKRQVQGGHSFLVLMLGPVIDHEDILEDWPEHLSKFHVIRMNEVSAPFFFGMEREKVAMFESFVEALGTVVRSLFKGFDLLDCFFQRSECLLNFGDLFLSRSLFVFERDDMSEEFFMVICLNRGDPS